MAMSEKTKAFIIRHLQRPELLTDKDWQVLDFAVDVVPKFMLNMAMYSLLFFFYNWLYTKYGFEKVMFYLAFSLLFAVGQLATQLRQKV